MPKSVTMTRWRRTSMWTHVKKNASWVRQNPLVVFESLFSPSWAVSFTSFDWHIQGLRSYSGGLAQDKLLPANQFLQKSKTKMFSALSGCVNRFRQQAGEAPDDEEREKKSRLLWRVFMLQKAPGCSKKQNSGGRRNEAGDVVDCEAADCWLVWLMLGQILCRWEHLSTRGSETESRFPARGSPAAESSVSHLSTSRINWQSDDREDQSLNLERDVFEKCLRIILPFRLAGEYQCRLVALN